MPAKTTQPKIASGIALVGLAVSSPIVDAPSKPAKERKPNVSEKNSAEYATPDGSWNTLSVNDWLPGGVPPISLAKIVMATIKISVTVIVSIVIRVRVLKRASLAASTQIVM